MISPAEHGVPRRWQYYLNPWWRERHVYVTQLDTEECRRRIVQSTTRFLGRSVARSFVSLTDFTLHRLTFYSNGMKPYAYVTLTDGPTGGTLVKVALSAPKLARFFWAFWFGFIGFWTLLASGAAFQQGVAGLTGPMFGMGMALFGFLLNAFGRTLAHSDRAFLLGYLEQELELKPPPPGLMSIA